MDLINKNLEKLEKNYNVLFENMVNKIVDKDAIFIREMFGDGNCFYRSLSFFFTNSQNYHDYFRNYIYNYIISNEEDIINEFPYINFNDKIININQYIQNINTKAFFSGELEILISAKIFKIDIIILENIK